MSSSLMNKGIFSCLEVSFHLMIHYTFRPKSQQINWRVNGLDLHTSVQNYFFAYDGTKDDISSYFLTFYVWYII